MGGTIRAAFNLAEYLTERGYEVEIISALRDRDEPFFGAFPAGVKVTALETGARKPARGPAAARSAPAPQRAGPRRGPRGDRLQPVDRHRAGPPAARARGLPARHAPGVNAAISRLAAPGLITSGSSR